MLAERQNDSNDRACTLENTGHNRTVLTRHARSDMLPYLDELLFSQRLRKQCVVPHAAAVIVGLSPSMPRKILGKSDEMDFATSRSIAHVMAGNLQYLNNTRLDNSSPVDDYRRSPERPDKSCARSLPPTLIMSSPCLVPSPWISS